MVSLSRLRWVALCLALLVSPPAWGGVAVAGEGARFFLLSPPRDAPPRISPFTLRRIYLGRITRWPGGTVVVPVNGPPRSRLRRQIDRWLFPEGEEAVRDHWRRAYYQGHFPPRALASYRAVALFVARVEGAVGYVPVGLPPPGAVQVEVVGEAPLP